MPDAVPLAISNLRKTYGDVVAVDDLSLDVTGGEILGLLGPNGAGKTTTSRTALGFLQADQGVVEIFGEAIDPRKSVFRQRVGYLPGEVRMQGSASGREILDLLARFHPGEAGAIRERRAELVERFDFDPSRKVRAYSKGNRQKLGLVAALQTGADLLVLDEPTSGLDPLVQQTLLEILRERAAQGAAVLFSSHVLSEVQAIADRLVVMRRGRIVHEGAVSALGIGTGRRVELAFESPSRVPALPELAGLGPPTVNGNRVRFRYEGEMQPLLALLTELGPDDVLIRNPELDDLFLSLYEDGAEPGSQGEEAGS